MIHNMIRRFRFTPLILIVLPALDAFQPVYAGPPLICHPFDIGGAKSLPWGGSEWRAVKADYDLNQLVEDTLALLTPDAPVIVRMETLRRATIYAVWAGRDREVGYAPKDSKVADELLSRLMARAKSKHDVTALFDAGYLAESYKQAGRKTDVDGYTFVAKAISLSEQDAEMEFAAALIALDGRREKHQQHLQKAIARATPGSLLAKNLVSHFGHLGKTLAELRTNVAKSKN